MPRPLKYDVSYLQVGEVKEFQPDNGSYAKMRRAIVATAKRHGKQYKLTRGDGVVRVERIK